MNFKIVEEGSRNMYNLLAHIPLLQAGFLLPVTKNFKRRYRRTKIAGGENRKRVARTSSPCFLSAFLPYVLFGS